MKLSITAILLVMCCCCFGQKQHTYYLKNNGAAAENSDSADYVRIVTDPTAPSVLYTVIEFFKHGEKKLSGKSSTLNPVSFEGQCVEYFKNGANYAILNYKGGLRLGTGSYYYPNGKLCEVREYPDTGNRYNLLNENFLIKETYDSLGAPLVKNGNGYYKSYNSGLNDIVEEGTVRNSKKDSLWKGADTKKGITFIENYKAGVLINGIATYGDGSTSTYTGARSMVPQFEGGLKGWAKFLSTNIHYPRQERKDGVQGTVILGFNVIKTEEWWILK